MMRKESRISFFFFFRLTYLPWKTCRGVGGRYADWEKEWRKYSLDGNRKKKGGKGEKGEKGE